MPSPDRAELATLTAPASRAQIQEIGLSALSIVDRSAFKLEDMRMYVASHAVRYDTGGHEISVFLLTDNNVHVVDHTVVSYDDHFYQDVEHTFKDRSFFGHKPKFKSVSSSTKYYQNNHRPLQLGIHKSTNRRDRHKDAKQIEQLEAGLGDTVFSFERYNNLRALLAAFSMDSVLRRGNDAMIIPGIKE